MLRMKFSSNFVIKVLGPLKKSFDKILDKIGQPPLKAPNCLSSCVEFDKECLVEEDLRTDGFVMFDKTKGMDLKHAKLVMEELGRLHATSLLFEKEQDKDIEEIYPEIKVKYLFHLQFGT